MADQFCYPYYYVFQIEHEVIDHIKMHFENYKKLHPQEWSNGNFSQCNYIVTSGPVLVGFVANVS